MSAAKPRDYLVRSSKLRAWTAVDAASGSASAYREEEEEREGEEDEDEDDDDHSSPSSYRGSPPVIELPPPLDGSPRKATGRGKKAPKRKDVVADFEEELVAEYVELGLHEAARGERKTGEPERQRWGIRTYRALVSAHRPHDYMVRARMRGGEVACSLTATHSNSLSPSFSHSSI